MKNPKNESRNVKFRRGNIVRVDMNPVSGHEQGNIRPVLVMNDVPLPGGINIVLPITTKEKSYPLEVELDNRTTTQGVILCFQMRTLDLNARHAVFVENAPQDIVELCHDYIGRLTESI